VTVENNLRFPGQYFEAETGLHQNYFRDYDPGIGRYREPDPIGQLGALNLYAYVGNTPVNASDPHGLLTAVVYGVPVSGNPFGHIAIATSGQGVTSFGTDTPFGSSLTEYLLAQSSYRDQIVSIILTTPEEEAKIQEYLAQFYDQPLPKVPSADSHDTCATRTGGALAAAGFYDPRNPWSLLLSRPRLGVHSSLPEASAFAGGFYSNGLSISIPQGTVRIPEVELWRSFNP
jgi:RHS repeat-associated protein